MQLVIFVIILLSIFFKSDSKKNTARFVFISMLLLFMIFAFRSEKLGGDLERYFRAYEKYSVYSWDGIRKIFFAEDIKDPTYYFTGWLVSRIFENPQWWLGCIASLFSISTGILIYKESKIPVLSVIMLIALGYLSFCYQGLRQAVAISIILFSYYFLEKRKLVPFIVMVLLASLYHQTALVFLIVYPFSTMKLGKYHIITAIAAFAIFYLFRNQLLVLMNDVLEDQRYQGYTSGNAKQLTISGFIIQASIFCYNLYSYKKIIKNNKNSLVLYNLVFVGLMFQLYASFIAEMFRISIYFSIFNIILVPLVTSEQSDYKNKQIITMILITILLIYTFKDGLSVYKFFWQ